MCGVFGYVGNKPCQKLISDGLKTLEYRGYDSAGIASSTAGEPIHVVKRKGKLSSLEQALAKNENLGTIGIGHTRWATHGLPNDINAHPHVSENFALIHNGIIENYLEIKEELLAAHHNFISETDSEVVLRLIEHYYSESQEIEVSILKCLKRLKGSFALGVFSTKGPQSLYLAKRKSPVIIGKGKEENLFASDLIALTPHTEEFIFLEDEQIAILTEQDIHIKNFDGKFVSLETKRLANLEQSSSSKGTFKHYMLKEIFEQGDMIQRHIESFYSEEKGSLRDNVLGLEGLNISEFKQLIFLGCGSAFYSARAGEYFLEDILPFPISTQLASEFRYRKTALCPKTLIIALSQSGETADTLASAEFAKSQGCTVIALCNTPYSSLTRMSDYTLFMQAGVEIGVAATKTFTATLLVLMALRNHCAEELGLNKASSEEFLELKKASQYVNEVLELKEKYKEIAEKYAHSKTFFIGRGPSYAIALEGALKLKEISYVHAEAYAGGELKHGPLSLITEDFPTLAVCPDDAYAEKMLSNIEEIMARHGKVIALASPSHPKLAKLCEDILPCPQVKYPPLQSIINNITLQLFAYFLADKLGQDIDQPRNLAKSVTVE